MNKIRKWFYDRTKLKMEQENIESGLSVVDNELWEKKVKRRSRTEMIYTVFLILLVAYLIYRRVKGG